MTDTVETTTTIGGFFGGLALGTIICPSTASNATEYIYYGTDYIEEDEVYRHICFSVLGGNPVVIEQDSDQISVWVVSKDADGIEKEPVNDNVRQAYYRGWYLSKRVTKLEGDAYNLREISRRKSEDFARFNELLNEFANTGQYGKMCSDYENQLDRWNQELSTLKFVGRPRDWEVRVNIAGEIYYLEVEAQTESEAQQQVSDMSNRELLKKLIEHGCWFDDLPIKVAE